MFPRETRRRYAAPKSNGLPCEAGQHTTCATKQTVIIQIEFVLPCLPVKVCPPVKPARYWPEWQPMAYGQGEAVGGANGEDIIVKQNLSVANEIFLIFPLIAG